MTTTPPSDIDAQVAAFRGEIEGLAALDPDRAEEETTALFRELVLAKTSADARRALLRFGAESPAPKIYRDDVILGALSKFMVFVAVEVDTFAIRAHVDRLRDLALGCRVLGVTLRGVRS